MNAGIIEAIAPPRGVKKVYAVGAGRGNTDNTFLSAKGFTNLRLDEGKRSYTINFRSESLKTETEMSMSRYQCMFLWLPWEID